MIGGVTLYMLPHLSGVPHLHVNGPQVLFQILDVTKNVTHDETRQ